MIVIPVNSKTHGEQFIFIDGEDFDKVKDYKWSIHKDNNNFYAFTKKDGKTIKMHRLLTGFPKNEVDHKNGNGLHNIRDNLRECSRSENGRNRKKQSDASSIYKGVYFNKQCKKYKANIRVNGKTTYIGLFADEHKAAEEYNKKAKELHGEFALLNIIQGETK